MNVRFGGPGRFMNNKKTNDDYYTIDSFRTCIAACMRVSNCVKQEKCGISAELNVMHIYQIYQKR